MDDDTVGSVNRERKQSSGDLHSRLKTRKLLGVGETDDGDVHRSKLSQILGHSDKLYIRLPGGTKEWQLLMAVVFCCVGVIVVFRPGLLFESVGRCADQVASRLYGGYLITMSVGLWLGWRSQNREIAQFSLVGVALHSCVQFIVILADTMMHQDYPGWSAIRLNWPLLLWLSTQLGLSLIGAYLAYAMGCIHRRCGAGKPPMPSNQAEAHPCSDQDQVDAANS